MCKWCILTCHWNRQKRTALDNTEYKSINFKTIQISCIGTCKSEQAMQTLGQSCQKLLYCIEKPKCCILRWLRFHFHQLRCSNIRVGTGGWGEEGGLGPPNNLRAPSRPPPIIHPHFPSISMWNMWNSKKVITNVQSWYFKDVDKSIPLNYILDFAIYKQNVQ